MSDNLPADPNDSYYLTNCFACKAIAEPGEEYMRNYGGVVCLSCRAFFRRVHQKQIVSKFACKNGGKCVITRENRRQCPKCRHDLCLLAGMSETNVMTPEQKKERFRKMLKKQERQKQEMEQDPYCQQSQQTQPKQKRRRLKENSGWTIKIEAGVAPQSLAKGESAFKYLLIYN